MQENNNDSISSNPLSEFNGITESQAKTISMLENVFGKDSSIRMKLLFQTMKGSEIDNQQEGSSSFMNKDENMQDLNVDALSSGVQQWLPLINEICVGYPEVPADIMARLVQKESRGNRFARPMRRNTQTGQMEAISSARGLTQIMDKTLITYLGRDLSRRGVRGVSFDKNTTLSYAKEVYFRHTGLTESDIDRFDARFNLDVTAQNLTRGLQTTFFRKRLREHPERRGFYTYLIHHDGTGGAKDTVEFLEFANGNFTEEFWNQHKSMLPSFHHSFEQTKTIVNFALCVNGQATDEELQGLTNTRVSFVETPTRDITPEEYQQSTQEYLANTPSDLNSDPQFWIENLEIIGDSNAVGLTTIAERRNYQKEYELSKEGAQSESILSTKLDNLSGKPTAVVCCGYNDMNQLGSSPTPAKIAKEANDYLSLIDAVYNKALDAGTKVIVLIPHTFIPTDSYPPVEVQQQYQNKLKELINEKRYNLGVLRIVDNSPIYAKIHPEDSIRKAWLRRIQHAHLELHPETPLSPESSIEDSSNTPAAETPNETREPTSEGGSTGGGSDDSGSSSGSGDEE